MPAILIMLIAAILPAVIYVRLFYWADRYEREPIWLLRVAFLWGAVPAIILSLIGEILIGSPFIVDDTSFMALLVEQAVVAPIVEELTKGLALLGIYLFVRHEFDGVLDGIVYGALIGFGFAMTEDFVYYIGSYYEGGYLNLFGVIFLRGVIFGLNHAFYTGLTGIGFGIGHTTPGRFAPFIWPVVGLAAAMVIHALHNLGAATGVASIWGIVLSLLVAALGAGLTLLAVLLSWRNERATIRRELLPEVGDTVTAMEYAALISHWQRPLRRVSESDRRRDARRQRCVELALHKKRMRLTDERAAPDLSRRIDELRKQLRDELSQPPD